MTADTLSRAPGSEPAEQETLMEAETNAFVSALIDSIPASDTRLEEVRKKQCSDKICSQIMNFCKLDHWPETAKKDVNLRQYWFVRQGLTVQQGLLLFQSRLVIPAELQEEILQRLHQGHQGVVKCRALARSCVWWPGLSKKIEEVVGTCATCEKERKLPPEPLQPTKTPDYPWQKIAMDLFELNGHTYLIVVDYYSRWIETVHLKQTTSVTVIEHCKSIFARFGIPEIVLSDNGPQFNSREFLKFSQDYAFTHLTSSPYHQQGNGEAERAVQTVKNLLRKSTDPYIALLNYRTTPLQNGYSLAELMMSRKLRNCLPTMLSQHIPFKPEVEKFKVKDEHFRNQQKHYHDLRHRTKETPLLPKGQPVWVKTPTTKEAVVVKNATPRPVVVQTEQGSQRKNRTQLRRRSWNQKAKQPATPRATAILPKQNLDTRVERSNEELADDTTTAQLCQPADRPDNPPLERNGQKTVYTTKSGRKVNTPQRLDL